jgi:hypothetical protein
MKKTKSTLVVLGLTLLLAVAGAVVYAAGTSLSVLIDSVSYNCDNGSVLVQYTVRSTAAADAATVTATIAGVDQGTIQTIASGNVNDGGGWVFSGRNKSAEGSYTTSIALANGSYTVEVCATQAGSNGNPDKTACASTTLVVACGASPCSGEAFGEIPANKNLCKANGHINFQFRGDFGETATLVITGPDGNWVSDQIPVGRDGLSCNYHYNWDPGTDNGGAGTYSFKVTGNGHELTYGADLYCAY